MTDKWYKSKRLYAGVICAMLGAAPLIPETAPFFDYIPATQAFLGGLGLALAGLSKQKEKKNEQSTLLKRTKAHTGW